MMLLEWLLVSPRRIWKKTFHVLLPETSIGSWTQWMTVMLNQMLLSTRTISWMFWEMHIITMVRIALCSRNLQNVKLRLDFVEIWSFNRHSDFTWNQILVNSNSPKMSFLAILDTLMFEFWLILGLEKGSNLLKSKFKTYKMGKNNIFGLFEKPKFDFT